MKSLPSKIIVTGGAGFIGSNLVRRLVEQNRDVVVIDNFSRGSDRNLAGVPVEIRHVDLRNFDATVQAIRGADCVYHLAARVGSIEYSHGGKQQELQALQTNLLIDTNVLKACSVCNIEKLVYASSVAVYPIDRQQVLGAKFDESTRYPVNPDGGYGWAKLLGEMQIDLMEKCESSIGRIFQTYGEYCEFGQTAQVVASLIRKAINFPKEDFVVWGTGEQTRNFLYVTDCVDALLKLEEKTSYPPLKVNIGSEETVSIRKLAEMIVKISGKDIQIVFDPSKPIGPLSSVPDISKARKALDWEPRVRLEDGLRATYKYLEAREVGSSALSQ